MLKNSLSAFQKAMISAKLKYFSNLILKYHHSSKALFSVLNSALNPPVNVILNPSVSLCEGFSRFFCEKITSLRSQLQPSADVSPELGCSSATWSVFDPVSHLSLRETVDHLKPSFCSLDVLSPRILKQIFESVGTCLVSFLNKCLSTGTIPDILKQATVTPLLKNPSLDDRDFNNFQPISTLPFITKILEKTVLYQLQSFLNSNQILETFQSCFKTLHSTESALLRVSNDILLATDAGDSVILILLDLTSAFDTVDHKTILSRLEFYVGIQGTVLSWFRSYLTNRSFSVKLGNFFSSPTQLSCGVPQGSILTPILFSLYLLPLDSIFRKHGVSFHCYADDTHIYLPLKRNKDSALKSLFACLEEVKMWFSQNFLFLNESKTEVIVFGPHDNFNCSNIDLDYLSPTSSCTKNLGVLWDHNLKFEKQINAVISSCFFQLRLLSEVKCSLSEKTLEIAVHALITSRLDYCNSLYYGIAKHSIARLQLVQNAAAKFLKRKRKFDHVSPILKSLLWLPVHF
uniref:Reverse transcriptase domain-containing protein n=1 Tax=Cyprinus carpio TaxID=7962 RepID=A0A8C1LVL1_CYPCA